jgi:hypothetical protein
MVEGVRLGPGIDENLAVDDANLVHGERRGRGQASNRAVDPGKHGAVQGALDQPISRQMSRRQHGVSMSTPGRDGADFAIYDETDRDAHLAKPREFHLAGTHVRQYRDFSEFAAAAPDDRLSAHASRLHCTNFLSRPMVGGSIHQVL